MSRRHVSATERATALLRAHTLRTGAAVLPFDAPVDPLDRVSLRFAVAAGAVEAGRSGWWIAGSLDNDTIVRLFLNPRSGAMRANIKETR